MAIGREELAKSIGVSVNTIKNVLNDYPHVSPGMRKKVMDAVRELGYVPDESARNMARKRHGLKNVGINTKKATKNIGCIVYDVYNKYSDSNYTNILESIDAKTIEEKYHFLFFYKLKELSENPLLFNEMICPDKIDGLITIGTQLEGIKKQTIEKIKNIVSLGEQLSSDNDCLLFDNFQVGYDAVKYLAELGHKRIGYIGYVSPSYERFEGYRKALSDFNIPYDEKLTGRLESTSISKLSVYKELGYKRAREILERNKKEDYPTALLVVDEETIAGVVKAITEAGLKIPDDVSIVTIGNSGWLEQMYPPITSFVTNGKEIASIVVNRLIDKVKNPDSGPLKITVSYKLIERESCIRRNG